MTTKVMEKKNVIPMKAAVVFLVFASLFALTAIRVEASSAVDWVIDIHNNQNSISYEPHQRRRAMDPIPVFRFPNYWLNQGRGYRHYKRHPRWGVFMPNTIIGNVQRNDIVYFQDQRWLRGSAVNTHGAGVPGHTRRFVAVAFFCRHNGRVLTGWVNSAHLTANTNGGNHLIWRR